MADDSDPDNWVCQQANQSEMEDLAITMQNIDRWNATIDMYILQLRQAGRILKMDTRKRAHASTKPSDIEFWNEAVSRDSSEVKRIKGLIKQARANIRYLKKEAMKIRRWLLKVDDDYDPREALLQERMDSYAHAKMSGHEPNLHELTKGLLPKYRFFFFEFIRSSEEAISRFNPPI